MSYSPPKVYVSATAVGLRSVLDVVKETLLSSGMVPVEIPSFESDWSAVTNRLRENIESCDALIHIAGTRYGAEPDPATLPPGTPRRSYAQMEYFIGCEVQHQREAENFPVQVFVCPQEFPYDPAPGIEISEKWSLQDAHRNHLERSPHFLGCPESSEDLRQWAIRFREQFPPAPPPEEPPPPAPETQLTAQEILLPYHESDLAHVSVAGEAAQTASPDSGKRLRFLLVTGSMAFVAIAMLLAAAFLVLRHQGFFGGRSKVQKKPEVTVATASQEVAVIEPPPQPSTPPSAPATPPPKESPPSVPPPFVATEKPMAPAAPATAASQAPSSPPQPSPAPPQPAVAAKSSAPTLPAPTKLPSSPPPASAAAGSPEIQLVRRAAVALVPASNMSPSQVGKLYVDKLVVNGKTMTREDIVRQVDQFRRSWDTQSYQVIEGPTVMSGAGTEHVIVKVKTRFVGVPKTGVKFSTTVVTTEYGVAVGADGTALIESVREVSRE